MLRNKSIRKLAICLVLGYLCTGCGAGGKLTISNAEPRVDAEVKIVDAHDGRVIKFGDRYYLYGTRYGNSNGYTPANEFVSYSSTDMMDWKFEGPLLPGKATGIYYRPQVVYNEQTRKYILWYNWYPSLWDGKFAVAQSDSPTGPFTTINGDVKVKHSDLGVGDLGVFVDDDGRAYLSYNTISNHKVSVEELDADYLGSTMEGSEFLAEHSEAGAMFKRNGLYYLLTDYTCCFCSQGSGARVFTSNNPLGPFTFRQNINRYPGATAPLLHDGKLTDNQFVSFDAKENNGIEVWLTQADKVSRLLVTQFTGDRPGQCGEVDNPKVHTPIMQHEFRFSFFDKGEWKDIDPVRMEMSASALQQNYAIDFTNLIAERIRIQPLFADSTQVLHLAEVQVMGKTTINAIYKTTSGGGKPIIPAQQTGILQLDTRNGRQFIWMGDLWGSALDNVKGHDFQYWSAPLRFYENGLIAPLRWQDEWNIRLKK